MTRRLFALTTAAWFHAGSLPLVASKFPGRPSMLSIVLADVTASLNSAEIVEVAELASGLIDGLPPGAEFRVFPIHMDMDRPLPIITGEVPTFPGIWQDPILVARRHEYFTQRIQQQYALVNRPGNRIDQRTCILNALQFVDAILGLPEYQFARKQVSIVSDMIEECAYTPLGRPVNLDKSAIDAEVSVAAALAAVQTGGPDWSAVKVVVALPSNPEPSGRSLHRPRITALRAFWTQVFLHYRVESRQIVWAIGEAPRLAPFFNRVN